MSTFGFGAEPRPNSIARGLTVVLGFVLLAIAGVAIRDAWYLFDGGDPASGWIATALTFLATASVTLGGVIVGALIVLAAMWLIFSAIRPRKHSHVQIRSTASMWMRPVDIARKSTALVRQEFGADDISSQADRKRLTINVAHDDSGDQFVSAVDDVVSRELDVLESAPQVRVVALPVEPREV